MIRWFALALCLLASPAAGQSVRQSGNVTPTHFACFTTNGVIQDCGSSANPYPTSGGVIGPFCVLSATPGSVAWQSFCLQANSTGGILSAQSFGTAPTPGISFLINGAAANIPLVTGAITNGDYACFTGTSGTLADCGKSPNGVVYGPGASISGHFATWNNSAGTLLADGGAPAASATIDTTNASNISSGFLALARGGLGGSQAAATANQIPVYPGSAGAAVPTSFSTWFDAVAGSSNCMTPVRTSQSGWIGLAATILNVECFNILPGNSASTNSTNFTNGYGFNDTFTLTARQGIYCAYRGDPTVSGNLVQTSTASDLFHIHGGYTTIFNCTLSLAGGPTGAQGIKIGDDAQQVTTGNVITSGNAQIACSSCTFTSGDVGKQITIINGSSGPTNLIGSILTFVDATHVTVSPTPGNSVNNTTIGWGFNYQENDIIDTTIYNYSAGLNVVAATQFHVRHVYVVGADPLAIQNIIWSDQGDGSITESTFIASVAGAHNTVNYVSGGGLRFINNKVLAQAAITNCIQVAWSGVSSVGPWLIGNSIEGGCTNGIAVNGTVAAVANAGIIQSNEIGIASAGTSINFNPTNDHPNWVVNGNVLRQTGNGTAMIFNHAIFLNAGQNNCQNTDATSGGTCYSVGSTSSGSVYVTATNVTVPLANASANVVIDDPIGLAFTNLPANAKVGSRIFISDADPATSPCASAGAKTGSTAFRQNGAWKCF